MTVLEKDVLDVLLPGFWAGTPAQLSAGLGGQLPLQQALRALPRSVPLWTWCTGVALAAAAGRLDGEAATGTWWMAAQLSRAHPEVDWQWQTPMVSSRRVATASGVHGYLPILAQALERRISPEAWRDVQRLMVLPRPQPAASVFDALQTLHGADPLLARLRRLVERTPAVETTLERLAGQDSVHGLVAGRVVRLLFDAGRIDRDEASRAVLARYAMAAGYAVTALAEPEQLWLPVDSAEPRDVAIIGLWEDDPATSALLTRLAAEPTAARVIIVADLPPDESTAQAGFAWLNRPVHRYALKASLAPADEPDTTTATVTIDVTTEPAGGRRPRVLLAEDNRINQTVATLQLDKLGFDVEVVNDGEAAVNAYVASPDRYRLILMDCQMPRLDGFGVARALRAAQSAVKVIFLTIFSLIKPKILLMNLTPIL